MKIAISGKGGTGKTTLSALIIEHVAALGHGVLAVDADPDPNLAQALGFADADEIVPISHMKELIKERIGSDISGGSFFKLNPKVDDIPDRFSLSRGNLKLISMGHVEEGGAGCMCPANSFLKNILDHILINEGDWVVVDMEAGVEHLGRATARFVDALLVTVEPSPKAAKTAERIQGLAKDIGLTRVAVVGTKIRGQADLDYLAGVLGTLPMVGHIPFSDDVQDAERRGDAKIDIDYVPSERIEELFEGIRAL
jgi:CO dehydrogenase maturation factor